MFWDGHRWVPDEVVVPASPAPRRRRARDWISTGVMLLVLGALVLPLSGTFAARPPARALLATWAEDSKVITYQEGNSAIKYRGRWVNVFYDTYLGGRARATNAAGAKVALNFKGTAISWVGPIGPTRGSAKVYLDGKHVKTISTWNASFKPTRVLFQKSWSEPGSHRIAIVATGTDGHPTVALDAFVVRVTKSNGPARVDDGGGTDTGTAPRDPGTEAPADPTEEPAPDEPTEEPATDEPTEEPAGGEDDPVQTPTPASPTSAPTAAPTATAAPPTPTPTPTKTPTPTPTPTKTPTPTATPAPTPGSSVRVTSVPALLTALANNAVTEIVVANGTYKVSPASQAKSDSLWIGSKFAGRTNPVTVRAETTGGVTFDGGGSTSFGGLTFVEGAHHQTWEGFTFANGSPVQTGVIVFGGYAGRAAPHHITLRSIKLLPSITGSTNGDHGIYFSYAVGGPHDILIEDFTVDGGPGLSDALHFYHSDASNKNVWNLTVRRLTVNRTEQPIRMWDSSLRNVLIDTATIRNATWIGVRVEDPGQGITFKNVTTINSAQDGFYSSSGNPPPGVTFINNSFD